MKLLGSNHPSTIKLIVVMWIAGHAAQAQSDTTDFYSLSLADLVNVKVITASKSSEGLTEAGAVITVISSKEIESYGANSLMDVLDRATSIYTLGTYTYTKSLISIRGNSSSVYNTDVLILLDGRPMRESLTSGMNFSIYNSFPVDRIESIEIIRGPGSILYGTSAFVGVVNIITKSAAKNNGVTAIARYGSFNTINGSLSLSKNIGKLEINAGLNYLNSEGWDYNARGEVDYIRNKANTLDSIILDPKTVKASDRSLGADLSLKYKGFKLATMYTHSDMASISNNARWGGSPNPLQTGPIDYHSDATRFFADLGYSHEFSKAWITTINVTNNVMNTTTGRPDLINDKFIFQSNDLLIELTNFIKPTDKLNIVLGGLTNTQTGKMDGFSQQPGVGGGPHDYVPYNINDAQLPLNPNPLKSVSPYNLTSWSAYLQADYKITRFLKIIGGAQANKISGLDLDIVPRIGAITNITKKFGTKLLYGEAYRAPSAFERAVNAPPVLIGNPNITPEKIKTFDAQLFYSTKEGEIFLTYYKSKQVDQIVRTLPSENSVVINGVLTPVASYTNRNILDSHGFELEGKRNFSKSFSMMGSATYQTSEDNNGKKDAGGMPKTMFKLGLNYTSSFGLSAGLFNSYFGKAGSIATAATRNLNPEVNAYNYLSLNVQYELSKLARGKMPKTLLGLYGANLLDEEVYYSEFVRRNMNSVPGRSGRAFYATLTCKF